LPYIADGGNVPPFRLCNQFAQLGSSLFLRTTCGLLLLALGRAA
jgi:hypothetical protein